jgi:hypothetical protein
MQTKHPMKLDAGESVFFKRELEYIKARTYDTKQKVLKAISLFPVSGEAGPGATEITFRKYTGVGFAKVIADYASDFPRVDVYGEEVTRKVKGLGDSYGYSIEEIRASQMANKNLDQRRANAARRAQDELVDRIAWNGLVNYNIPGFINYPGISEYTVPNDGTGTTKTWSTKTADQILRDMNALAAKVVEVTSGREIPDTILLPLQQYNLISTMRVGTASDTTVLQYFLKTSPYIKAVEWVNELDAAGAGSADRMMVYARDTEHLTLEIPQPFEQFDAVQKGMAFEIPCHSKTAGILVYYPLSIAFGDGI